MSYVKVDCFDKVIYIKRPIVNVVYSNSRQSKFNLNQLFSASPVSYRIKTTIMLYIIAVASLCFHLLNTMYPVSR